MNRKKIVIVGGVAGGMSCAARARRLSETAEIIVFERGPHPSFANCGLPYHMGGEIADASKLVVQSAEKLRQVQNLDVRTRCEVLKIDRANKEVLVHNLQTGEHFKESYEALVLSPGAAPLRPPIPGIDLPGVFTLRNIPDMEAILERITTANAKRIVVGGGGYIGLEVAEQLRHRGLEVAVAEAAPQVMMPVDAELAELLHAEIRRNGVELFLQDAIARFEGVAEGESEGHSPLIVHLKSGAALPADVVILGLGVKPENTLAKDAGLEIGALGGIRVNEHMQTNDPTIYAVGDAVEVKDVVTQQWALIPLAGPANRMGRIVADNLFGMHSTYNGTQGTAVLRVFQLVAGCTGANEKTCTRLGLEYESIHLHPTSHAGYYPGAHPIALKVLFNPTTGKLLGAQAVGKDGVDKRIDVFATALAAGFTMDDLAELELAYAPPFGSAKDPVNLAGMIAQNLQAGLVRQVQWNELQTPEYKDAVILDVRDKSERDAGALPNSLHIPLGEIRNRLSELPKERLLIVHCASGQRSYNACRILTQNGFNAVNLSGSYKTWAAAMQRAQQSTTP